MKSGSGIRDPGRGIRDGDPGRGIRDGDPGRGIRDGDPGRGIRKIPIYPLSFL
jgi:hypothetical protein